MTVDLVNGLVGATIVPERGGRIQQVEDRRTGRRLLDERTPAEPGSTDYLDAMTGGWDLLFPNDEPWRGHPDHGRVWQAPFDVQRSTSTSCELEARLGRPDAIVSRRSSLLAAPRRGVREEIEIVARTDTGPFLVAPHPILACGEGWTIELADGARDVSADSSFPGRFDPDQALDAGGWAIASRVPAAAPPLVEVLYVDGVDSGAVASPDGTARTRVSWDAAQLPHLWICFVTGYYGDESLLLLEPCTSRPFRLDEAIAAGGSIRLTAGESWSGWVELESLDVLP
jgi:hypothetical protein